MSNSQENITNNSSVRVMVHLVMIVILVSALTVAATAFWDAKLLDANTLSDNSTENEKDSVNVSEYSNEFINEMCAVSFYNAHKAAIEQPLVHSSTRLHFVGSVTSEAGEIWCSIVFEDTFMFPNRYEERKASSKFMRLTGSLDLNADKTIFNAHFVSREAFIDVVERSQQSQ